MARRTYYVYIITNLARTLYVGVTSNIQARVHEHRQGTGSVFTARYKLTRLVFVEETDDVQIALAREKQIKSWVRQRKIELIEGVNPSWNDLAAGWYGEGMDPSLSSG